MASRYLVATGNWSSTSIWSATSGGASGASVPTSSDSVYIDVNYTVTLTANASCVNLIHTNGTITINTFTLSCIYGFESSGSIVRTINLNSGILEVVQADDSTNNGFSLSGTNLNWNAGTSLIKLGYGQNFFGLNARFDTLGKIFNDVNILPGYFAGYSTIIGITGSPTFRSLVIQSKNSSAHTVTLDTTAGPTNISINQLIIIGASSTNKLTLNTNSTNFVTMGFSKRGTSYGQFVAMGQYVSYQTYQNPATMLYIGSNSTSLASGWVTQDPPKISTLIDPLTTTHGSNTNWIFSGTITEKTTGYGGGGYEILASATVESTMVSTNTYDFTDATFIVQNLGNTGGSFYSGIAVAIGLVASGLYADLSAPISGVTGGSSGASDNTDFYTYSYPSTQVGNSSNMGSPFLKTVISSSAKTAVTSTSSNGTTWANVVTATITNTDLLFLKSSRINAAVGTNYRGTAGYTLGSINPSLGTIINKTQTSLAQISLKYTKTNTSYAYIIKNFNKNQNAIAKINANVSKTQSVNSRIANKVLYIQPAKSYITQQLHKSQNATGHVVSIVSKTQFSVSRISNKKSKNQLQTARIAKKFNKTQQSIGHISIIPTNTQSVKSAVIGLVLKNQQIKANISTPFTNQQSLVGRISQKFNNVQPIIAAIGRTGLLTQPANTRIITSKIKTQSVTAHVNGIVNKYQSAGAYLIKIAEARKIYIYKMYNNGQFLGLLPNVTSEFILNQDINTAGSQITIEVGVSADTSYLPATQTITDESGLVITDELGNNLLTEGAVNIVGTGVTPSLIRNGNKIKVIEISKYYPNGHQVFSGEIDRWEADFGLAKEGIMLLAYSDGQDMDNYLVQGSPFVSDQTSATQNASTNIQNQYGGSAGYQYGGQTFTTGSSITNIGAVGLWLQGTATATVRLFSSVPSSPTNGTPIATSTVNVSQATPGLVQFAFPTPLNINPLTQYFFDVGVGVGQTMNIYYNSTNPYSGGTMYIAAYGGGSGGGSWAATPVGSITTASDLYFLSYSSAGATTAVFSSQDPTTGIAEAIMNAYKTQGGLVTYTGATIDATALSLSYTFNTSTVYEGIKTILSLSPSGFYYYVDVGTSVLHFKNSSAVPDITIIKGKNIESLKFVATIENIKNLDYFSGGVVSGSNLFKVYKDTASIALYGQRLNRSSDNRVTLTTTANAIGQSYVAENKDEQYQTEVVISDNTMDISLFKVGMIIGFRGYGSFVDTILTQVVRLAYTPNEITLTLGLLPRRVIPEFEKITRGLVAQQTVANPTSPS
jgi:hypothetical protein